MSTETTTTTAAPVAAATPQGPIPGSMEAALAALEGAPAKAAATAEVPLEKPKEEVKPAVVEDKTASKFVALAKKERSALDAQGKLKAKEAELVEKEKKIQEYENSKLLAAQNPEAIAKQLWGDDWYEKLTEYVLKGGDSPKLAQQAVSSEVAQLRAELKAEKEAAVKAQQDREAALVQKFHSDAIEFVKSHAETYELTNVNEAHHLVPQVMEEHFTATQKVLSFAEAADMVEKYLEDQVQKNLASKKFQARAAPKKPSEGEPKQEKSTSKTLSNEMTANASPSFLNNDQFEEDRFKRAMAALDTQH
jgi:hypothetical protein